MTETLELPDIEVMLPHAGAMCMISRVRAVDATIIRCEANNHTALDHPLRHRGRLPVTAGIEYGAQAAALHSIVSTKTTDPGTQLAPRAGYLAVLRDVRWQVGRLDDQAAPLEIIAERLTELATGLHYRFTLHGADQKTLIEGELIIALMPT